MHLNVPWVVKYSRTLLFLLSEKCSKLFIQRASCLNDTDWIINWFRQFCQIINWKYISGLISKQSAEHELCITCLLKHCNKIALLLKLYVIYKSCDSTTCEM